MPLLTKLLSKKLLRWPPWPYPSLHRRSPLRPGRRRPPDYAAGSSWRLRGGQRRP
ncbi:MAG: hypothetical protein WKG07_28505 [Hymenobacter sp.]